VRWGEDPFWGRIYLRTARSAARKPMKLQPDEKGFMSIVLALPMHWY
jgi:hypothetical protein